MDWFSVIKLSAYYFSNSFNSMFERKVLQHVLTAASCTLQLYLLLYDRRISCVNHCYLQPYFEGGFNWSLNQCVIVFFLSSSQEIIAFQTDKSMEVRKFVIGFIEEAW